MSDLALRQSEIRSLSLVTTWQRAADLSPKLKLGDLVEFKRKGYKHWGVYIGTDIYWYREDIQRIAHISAGAGDFDNKYLGNTKKYVSKILHGSTATVVSDSFFSVAGQDLCRVNNSLDLSRKPFPRRNIRLRALFQISPFFGEGSRYPLPPEVIRDRDAYQGYMHFLEVRSAKYNLLQNNCEHFAKWCRYGRRESDQAIVSKTALIGVTAFVITGSWIVALTVTIVVFWYLDFHQTWIAKP